MDTGAFVIAAATGGNADFLVGVIVGACLAFLLGPALRSWIAFREWTEASREERLVEQLMDRIERETDPVESEDRPLADRASTGGGPWRTLR